MANFAHYKKSIIYCLSRQNLHAAAALSLGPICQMLVHLGLQLRRELSRKKGGRERVFSPQLLNPIPSMHKNRIWFSELERVTHIQPLRNTVSHRKVSYSMRGRYDSGEVTWLWIGRAAPSACSAAASLAFLASLVMRPGGGLK